MKKTLLFSGLIMAMVSISFISNATVWRVCSAPGSDPDYSSIQAAHDAATTLNGDTLYIEPSSFSVGGLSPCNKRLVILGTGYFLSENPQTQASLVGNTIDYLYFNPGSQGSKVAGCNIGYIYLLTDDILITRNKINGYSYGIYNQAAVANIIITQNYFVNAGVYNIYFYSPANNILISNNFITGSVTTGSSFVGIFTNNVFSNAYLSVNNATFKNNIMESGNFYPTNCIVSNNISNGTQFGNLNNNQENVTMSTVFVGPTGNSTDGQWQLKAGSPAIGAGEGGVDCGMYGGAFPYVLSGMPNIPAIYYFNAPSMPSNSINVAIKAKSHN